MYSNHKWDARYFQILFQLTFLGYGIVYLSWQPNWALFATYIVVALATQWVADSLTAKAVQPIIGNKSFMYKGGLSAVISAASLCLLLKSNELYIGALASVISIGSKYVFRIGGKHIFNPSALGIVAVLYGTGNAWLLPSQWGFSATILFMVATLGIIVITKVQKLDVCFAFLLTFLGLLYYRQVIYLHWSVDVFWQSMSTGSLLLFSFFMISDPKTAPNHKYARVLWGIAIGATAYYFTIYQFVQAAPIKVLVLLAPLVPLFNALTGKNKNIFLNLINTFKLKIMQTNYKFEMPNMGKKITAIIILFLCVNSDLWSFCGFYVAKADGTIKNKTSQVIMVRDGNKNVVTMYNDYKGDLKDFAMVVPVPTILKQNDIKVVDQNIFTILNDYSKPRLVEYWDQNPCNLYDNYDNRKNMSASEVIVTGVGKRSAKDKAAVTIEAQYIVGEYDILILSAKESGGLKNWLLANGYKLPTGAEEVLEPYIKSNLKFFVVKVNMEAKKKLPGDYLRPLQITFNSPKFMLPIRLGMANADGDQDMIVYAFTKKGRVECTNYRTASLPTGNNVPLFVKDDFGKFYSTLFENQWQKEGKNVAMLEYAWNVTPNPNIMKCDPCVATVPTATDLVQAGVWWLNSPTNYNNYDGVENDEEELTKDVYFTRLHIRYNRANFAQDLNFMYTPNKENYQARYVINHPAEGDFSCTAGAEYLKKLKQRRKEELIQLQHLTGKTYSQYTLASTTNEENSNVANSDATYAKAAIGLQYNTNNTTNYGLLALGLLAIGALIYVKQKSIVHI